MNSKRSLLENFKLYVITDLQANEPEPLAKIQDAYRGGADIVQLRSKSIPDMELYRIGLRVREIADCYGKLFFVNDRVDLALAVHADGVHLGQEDLPIDVARRVAHEQDQSFFVGKSTHSLDQAIQAEKESADYIGVGPVFGTPTKPGYKPVGLDVIGKVRAAVKIPFVAIGGIDLSNLPMVMTAGADRVAVVRAVFGAADVYQAAHSLRQQIETCISHAT